MYGHVIFCGQTKPIFFSKVLPILYNAEYRRVRIYSKCNHCHFILQRSLCVMWVNGSIYIGSSFLEEIGTSGPITCTVNGAHYSLVCAIISFLLCNNTDVWIVQLSYKVAFSANYNATEAPVESAF